MIRHLLLPAAVSHPDNMYRSSWAVVWEMSIVGSDDSMFIPMGLKFKLPDVTFTGLAAAKAFTEHAAWKYLNPTLP